MMRLPPYFDGLIAARRAGQIGRHVHLGYWDNPPSLATPCPPAEFEASQARLAERMVGLAGLRGGERVLDVGCGFGGTLALLGARLQRMMLTGVNIDPRQLAICQGITPQQASTLDLVAADACALPFPAASFDHVFCVEAMFHFASRATFLAEAARVLRPGGGLTVCDIMLHPPDAAPWPRAVMEAAIRRDYGPWPELWVEPAQVQHTAAAVGLAAIVAEDWSAASLPSYRMVAPDGRIHPDPSAGAVFRWLQGHGWLTYAALGFVRRRSDGALFSA
jgi:ubiquinone/menaquinone biosynthesis C-methylase UbiE